MNIEACIHKICEAHPWVARWARLGQVVVQAGGRAWEIGVDEQVPNGLDLFGCTGRSIGGDWHWCGWDLDVGHGTAAYSRLNDAIFAGKRLARHLPGYTEVRLSKSGKGVHVRQLFDKPMPGDFPIGDYAKSCAADFSIQGDASPLGRQVFWLWSRPPRPERAFEEVSRIT